MEQHSTEETESHERASNGHYQNIDEQAKNEEEDIQGKIFIGGLSWQTTEQTLRYYFEKFGELSDVALMMDKRTGKPRYGTLKTAIYVELH